jgi:hypothetical protein
MSNLKISPNQIVRPILLGEMVKKRKEKKVSYAVFGHFGAI